jgi:hypothetical protein
MPVRYRRSTSWKLLEFGEAVVRPTTFAELMKNPLPEWAPDQAFLKRYQSAVGSLMYYVAMGTRPDIAFAVGILSRFLTKPRNVHWVAAKRIMRYLRGTTTFGPNTSHFLLRPCSPTTHHPPDLTPYSPRFRCLSPVIPHDQNG